MNVKLIQAIGEIRNTVDHALIWRRHELQAPQHIRDRLVRISGEVDDLYLELWKEEVQEQEQQDQWVKETGQSEFPDAA